MTRASPHSAFLSRGQSLARAQQVARVGSAHADALAAVQDGDVIPAKPRLYFLDAIEVDDPRFVHAQKASRIEVRGEDPQARSDAVLLVADAKLHVVARSLEVIDVLCAPKDDILILLDAESSDESTGARLLDARRADALRCAWVRRRAALRACRPSAFRDAALGTLA